MTTLLDLGLTNALAAVVLAPLAALAGRASRRPAMAHGLWLLVLLKLLIPPWWEVPITLPAAPSARVETPMAPRREAPRPVVSESPVVVFEPTLVSAPQAPPPEPPFPWPRPSWRTVVGVAWLAGTSAWLLLAAARMRRFARSLEGAKPAPADLQQRVDALARLLGLKRGPEVVLVPGPISPLIWAWGGPARLVLPAGLWACLDDEQRATLLVHELAHLRRRDHWVRALELLATALYWWHPALWWARRGLRQAEEQCCDAWVVWALPDEGKTYATALVETVDFLSSARTPLPLGASGMGRVHQLSRRITMVMRGTTPRRLSWPGSLGMLALGGLLLPWLPTQAQQAGTTATGTTTTSTRPDEPRGGPTADPRPAAADLPAAKGPDEPAGGSSTLLRDRLERARAATSHGREMFRKGFVSQTQLDRLEVDERALADQIRQEEKRLAQALDTAREEMDLSVVQIEIRRAAVEKSKAQRQLVLADLARLQKLNKPAPGFVSETELTKAEAQVRVADAEVAEKVAEQRESEVRAGQARRRHDSLKEEVHGVRQRGARPATGTPATGSDELPLSVNNLKRIGIALHNYMSSNNHFPPPALRDKEGKPGLSWRVALLPFLEEEKLYRQFHLDEPWDSPTNQPLSRKMPAVFRIPASDLAERAPSSTYYQAVVGPATIWGKPDGVMPAEIVDGTSNTIMVVEAAVPVVWTAPEDVTFSDLPHDAPPKLGVFANGFNALFCDGSVRLLRPAINPLVFRALLTRADGEVVSSDALATPPPANPAGMMARMMEGARATQPAPANPGDPQRRLDDLERKLDRLLKEVESLRLERNPKTPPSALDPPSPDKP